MSGALWTVLGIVAGGLVLAAVKWLIGYGSSAVADKVVAQIGDSLQDRWQVDIQEAVAPIFDELSYNGGTSVKDIVRRIERQIEALLSE